MTQASPKKPKKPRTIELSRLFPNMVTIGALCCGLTSIRFAMLERWELAALFIVVAAVLDAMDGALARMLNAQSNFGAQLDSLSDVVSFGVAPALGMHMWILQDVKRFGWAAALFFVVCCGLRLARFNAMLQEEEDCLDGDESKRHFMGVPAPAAALLALFPLGFYLEYPDAITFSPWFCILYIILIASLMVSRYSTFSLKRIRIPRGMALPVMLGAVALIVLAVIEPWNTIMLIGTIYLISIPYMAWCDYKKIEPSWDSLED